MAEENKNNTGKNKLSEQEKTQKVQSLRDMITSAEKTIQSAKAMLLQLEGKKKVGRRKKTDTGEIEGNIIEGTFNGQTMTGTDGKQYPVPSNYASKSKLVEGDMLKLTITPDGSFIYKQIGPVERRNLIGIASQDENGNYYVIADGKPYKILLASVTYFQVEPGDEIAIVTSRDTESSWAAVENVIQKGEDNRVDLYPKPNSKLKPTDGVKNSHNKKNNASRQKTVIDEWAPDIKEIEKEIRKEKDE